MAIISKQQLKQIDESLKVLAAAKVEINRAKSAGFDMAEKENQVRELEERLIKIKQVYGAAQ
jgi:F0F1-type ATP synthase delta subunit